MGYSEREKTGFYPDKRDPWTINLGYNPKTESLVTSSVEVPVHSPQTGEALVLTRIETGNYIILHRPAKDRELELFQTEAEKLEAAVYDRSPATALSEDYINVILSEAGYVSPSLFTRPNDVQEHLVQTLSDSVNWERQEVITRPIDTSSQIHITRRSRVVPTSQYDEGLEEYVRESTEEIETILDFHSNDGTRSQVVITFSSTGHFVDDPKIIKRELAPAEDSEIIAKFGPDAYLVVSSETVELEPELIDELAEELAEKF